MPLSIMIVSVCGLLCVHTATSGAVDGEANASVVVNREDLTLPNVNKETDAVNDNMNTRMQYIPCICAVAV